MNIYLPYIGISTHLIQNSYKKSTGVGEKMLTLNIKKSGKYKIVYTFNKNMINV